MATTSATPKSLAKVQDAVAFLRAAGREEEAVAVESLLPPPKPRRLPPAPPSNEHDLVPIADDEDARPTRTAAHAHVHRRKAEPRNAARRA